MCGIFGLINYSGKPFSHLQAKMVHRSVSGLLKESEVRGQDAAGLAILTEKNMTLFKDHMRASELVETSEYSSMLGLINKRDVFKAMIGHTRYKTKGHQLFNVNNHPIRANRIVGVHNGFISNDDFLFGKYASDVDRRGMVDSEIIFRLIDFRRRNNKTIVESVQETCDELAGTYTCAFIDVDAADYVTIFSNSAYVNTNIHIYEPMKLIVFASNDVILARALKNSVVLNAACITHDIQVANTGFRIDIRTGKVLEFDVTKKKQPPLLTRHARWARRRWVSRK